MQRSKFRCACISIIIGSVVITPISKQPTYADLQFDIPRSKDTSSALAIYIAISLPVVISLAALPPVQVMAMCKSSGVGQSLQHKISQVL